MFVSLARIVRPTRIEIKFDAFISRAPHPRTSRRQGRCTLECRGENLQQQAKMIRAGATQVRAITRDSDTDSGGAGAGDSSMQRHANTSNGDIGRRQRPRRNEGTTLRICTWTRPTYKAETAAADRVQRRRHRCVGHCSLLPLSFGEWNDFFLQSSNSICCFELIMITNDNALWDFPYY